ncbi:MAG TPA: M48 family metallopeptidase [Acidiferrobacteraceae bacterium]|nr:M48 family metallopeptidase [Acidiferrobacteraceae bacterium]
MNLLTTRFAMVFLAALGVTTVLRVLLGWRQRRCIEHCPEAAGDARARAYALAKLRLEQTETLYLALITATLTTGGGLAWLTRHWSYAGTAHGTAFLLMLLGLLGLLELPLEAYRTFGIEARFGFNRTAASLWLQDIVKKAALAAALMGPMLYLLLRLLADAGRFWWVWMSAAFSALQIVMVWIYPTWIAPLFNRLESLPPGTVRSQAEALLARNQISHSALLVANGSLRSTHGNAYVAGFGKRRRIVFFDTLLTRLTPEQVCAVLAHEMGHVRAHHLAKHLVLVIPYTTAALAFLAWIARAPWFFSAFGLAPAPALAVALVLVGGSPLMFCVRPLFMALSRHHEYEADRFAQRQGLGAALAVALLTLYHDNASAPCQDPWYMAFHYTHPPPHARIARLQPHPPPTPTAT